MLLGRALAAAEEAARTKGECEAGLGARGAHFLPGDQAGAPVPSPTGLGPPGPDVVRRGPRCPEARPPPEEIGAVSPDYLWGLCVSGRHIHGNLTRAQWAPLSRFSFRGTISCTVASLGAGVQSLLCCALALPAFL